MLARTRVRAMGGGATIGQTTFDETLDRGRTIRNRELAIGIFLWVNIHTQGPPYGTCTPLTATALYIKPANIKPQAAARSQLLPLFIKKGKDTGVAAVHAPTQRNTAQHSGLSRVESGGSSSSHSGGPVKYNLHSHALHPDALSPKYS